MPQDVYAVSVAATKVQLPSETHSVYILASLYPHRKVVGVL